MKAMATFEERAEGREPLWAGQLIGIAYRLRDPKNLDAEWRADTIDFLRRLAVMLYPPAKEPPYGDGTQPLDGGGPLK